METTDKTEVTVQTTINAPVEKVWKLWSDPQHITGWCNASDDWHAPYAENDLRNGGSFKTTMAAKDGSMQFDFGGIYSNVKEHELIEYAIGDGRKVRIEFSGDGDQTTVIETFETENTHPVEMQREGWQSILNNFKKYVESNN
ncbi:MAG: polyketide cyclase [Bacteroidota bacterium]|nr:polyketide cyclase [Bacteroidota bacterium]